MQNHKELGSPLSRGRTERSADGYHSSPEPIVTACTHQSLRSRASFRAAVAASLGVENRAKHVGPDPDMRTSLTPGRVSKAWRPSPTTGEQARAAGVRSLSCSFR